MIPQSRRAWFSTWFARQCRRRLHATFDTIEVAGLNRLRDATSSGPVVAVANHTAWWDPMFALELSQSQLGVEAFAMMDASNLRRLRFFSLVGAFGVDRSSRRDGVRAIRHGATLLNSPGRLVWVFPQGSERPVHEPLDFFPGAARIAELADAAVVPIAFRYVFSASPKPRALAAIGDPLPPERDRARAVAAQQEAVTAQLRRVERHLSELDADFECLHRAGSGWLDPFLSRALDRFARVVLGSADEQPALAQAKDALTPAHPRRAEGPDEGGQ